MTWRAELTVVASSGRITPEQAEELARRVDEEIAAKDRRIAELSAGNGRAMIAVRCGDLWDSSLSCDWAADELEGWLPLPGGAS